MTHRLSISETPVKRSTYPACFASQFNRKNKQPEFPDLSEKGLLRDLLYSFQGADGKVLKWSEDHQEYRLDDQAAARLDASKRQYVQHLAQLGSLLKQLQNCCSRMRSSQSKGNVALIMRSELQSVWDRYCVTAAKWCSQIQKEGMSERAHQNLTLRRLLALIGGYLEKTRWMVAIARSCLDKKGGEIITCVHSFLHYGNPSLKSYAKELFSAICKSMFYMISRWMIDGELDDPYNEFFIAVNEMTLTKQLEEGRSNKSTLNRGDILWNEKYILQNDMVPSFISLTQAEKIFVSGKNINFIREMCQHSSSRTKPSTKVYAAVESLILEEKNVELDSMINSVHQDTSRQVVDILFGQFKLLKHLKAVRAFILLGQGDFIQYFMELLEPELSSHNVTYSKLAGIMETAVRTTNAQFEDSDILQRLESNIELSHLPEEVGWDTFYLHYNTDGPISIILEPVNDSYHALFRALWRAKRVDWVLCKMWKRQTTYSRLVNKIPEVAPLMKQLHLIVSEMVQFVHQMQYYVLFEVLECSWGEMMSRMLRAESLEDVIRSHAAFLDCATTRILIGNTTINGNKDISDVFRTVHDLALELQAYEDDIQERIDLELGSRAKLTAQPVPKVRGKASHEPRVTSGKPACSRFTKQHLKMDKADLDILCKRYRSFVRQFHIDLLEENDASLHMLSSRLDFNEYFKLLHPEISHMHTHYYRRTSLHAK